MTAVNSALAELRATAAARGLELSRLAWTAISTRLLGPGAHPDLPTALTSWLRTWDEAEARASRSAGPAGRGGTRGGERGCDSRLEPPARCSRPPQVTCRGQRTLAPRQCRMAGRRRRG